MLDKTKAWFGTHQMLGIAVGGAVGGLIGHYLVKKGHMWTTGLVVAGAIGGWWLGHQMAPSVPPVSAPASTTSTPGVGGTQFQQ